MLNFITELKPKTIILIEDITKKIIQEETWCGRPFRYYLDRMIGYEIVSIKHVDFPCVHICRKISTLFGCLQRSEGETISQSQKFIERILVSFKICIPCCYQGLHLMYFEKVSMSRYDN